MRIESTQISLRDWHLDDLPAWQHWQQPHHQWHRTDGPYYPVPSPAEIETRAALIRKSIQDGDWPTPRTGLVIADRRTDELVGRVIRYWQSEETAWLSLGIAVYDPSHWGRGIGFEALGLWMEYLFRAMPELVRLDLRTWSGNAGMIRLAEKLGYLEEARFRRARIVDGEYYDGLGFGILREEWERRYPDGFAASGAT
jgi:putative hydrolase of HD superfamily